MFNGQGEAAAMGWQGIAADVPRDRPVLIAGPTASGKSALAAQIVATGGGVIVNADALQVYACWRLLTARPSVAEEAALPHALYGHVGCAQPYSVGHWLAEVTALPKGARPVIVGGTGLYFMALTEGLAEIPAIPPQVRAAGDALRAAGGVAALLTGVDAATAARIDVANPARVQRAWEVVQATGRGLADWQDRTGPPLMPASACTRLVLTPRRDWLNPRCDARFDAMMAQGALAEVRANLPGFNPLHPAARAIGAPELVAHLQGKLPLAEAVALAKIATHQYAKRQRTWFRRRMRDWTALDPERATGA